MNGTTKRGGCRKIYKAALVTSTILAGVMAGVGTSMAAAPGGFFAAHSALPDAQLSDLRGGLRVGGFEFDIGVKIRSIVEGRLELLSELTLDHPGRWRPTWMTGRFLSGNEPGAGTAGGELAADLPVANVAPQIRTGGKGLSIALGDPATAQIVHQITDGNLATIINNALDNQSIVNSTEFDIGVTDISNLTTRLNPTLRLGAISRRAFRQF